MTEGFSIPEQCRDCHAIAGYKELIADYDQTISLGIKATLATLDKSEATKSPRAAADLKGLASITTNSAEGLSYERDAVADEIGIVTVDCDGKKKREPCSSPALTDYPFKQLMAAMEDQKYRNSNLRKAFEARIKLMGGEV